MAKKKKVKAEDLLESSGASNQVTGSSLLKDYTSNNETSSRSSSSNARTGTMADFTRDGGSSGATLVSSSHTSSTGSKTASFKKSTSSATPTKSGLVGKQLGVTKNAIRASFTQKKATESASGTTQQSKLDYLRALQDYSSAAKKFEESYKSYEDYLDKYTDYYSRDSIQSRLDSAKEQLKNLSYQEKAQDAVSRYGQYMTGKQRNSLKDYTSGASAKKRSELEQTISTESSRISQLDAEEENERLLSLDLDELQAQIDEKNSQREQQWQVYQNSSARGASFGGSVTRESINPTLTSEIEELQSEYDKAYNLQWRKNMSSKYADLSSTSDFASTSSYIKENDPQAMLTELQVKEQQLMSQTPDSAASAAKINQQLDDVRTQIKQYQSLSEQIGDTYHSLGSGDGTAAERFQYATDEEKAAYNYLINSGRYDEAEEYANYLNYNLTERRQSEKYQQNKEFAEEHPVISSALSVPANLVSGVGALDLTMQRVKSEETGLPVDYNTEWQDSYYYTNTVRGTISSDLDSKYGTLSEDLPVVGGWGLGELYQTGMSMADSGALAAVTMATGIPVIAGTSLLGGSAATASMQDAHNKGLTDTQAITTGILAGVAETLFEEVSLDKLISAPELVGGTASTQVKNWLKETSKQAGVEASEEFFTTAANLLSDFVVNGNQSDIMETYQSYLDQGLTAAQAAAKTFGDELNSAMSDALGGAISGGVMGGAKMAAATVGNNIQNSDTSVGKRVLSSGNTQQVLNLAEQLQDNSELYRQVAAQIKEGNLDAARVGQLAKSVEQIPQTTAIEERLSELGEEGDTSTLASAVYLNANARTMTAQQEQLLSASETGRQVASELRQAVRGNISEENSNTWAADAVNASRGVQSYQYVGRSGVKAELRDAVIQRNVERTAQSSDQATMRETQTPVTITGIKRVSSTEGGVSVIVKDENGNTSTVSMNELSRLPSSTSALMQEALSYTGSDASVMFATYTDGQAVGKYADVWSAGYEAGLHGQKMPTMSYGGYEKALQMAYETGKARAATENKKHNVRKGRQNEADKSKRAQRTGWRAGAASVKSGTVSYEGGTLTSNGVTYKLKAVDKESLNQYQKDAAESIEALVKAGVVDSVVFFASDVKNGKAEAFNGAYQDGTIYIDINAGKFTSDDGRRMILQTFAHELTHTLEGTQSYAELSEFVLSHIGETQLDEIKARLADTGMYSEDELEHEIVANACAEVLYDSVAIQAMAKENRTLYERVRDFIRGLINKIRQVYQQENGFRQESILMRDVSEKLAELWDTALIEKHGGEVERSDAEFMYREGAIEQAELEEGITAVAKMNSVSSLQSYNGSLKASDVVKTISEYFDSLGGSIENRQLGDVTLTKRGIKADLAHGIGREKVSAFVAIPDILQHGQVVDYQSNWKNRGYDTAVVAAPIQIDGAEYVAGVLLKRTNGENKFYVHEVLTMKKGASPFNQAALQSGDVDSGGDVPSINKILQRILNVKDEKSPTSRETQAEFSMREPVEETAALLALHNLTEQNLLDTIRLGGFPMPSIAVVKAEAGHSKYGPISVVLPKNTIDPQTDSRNHVYGSDAYTPTAPNVEYPVNSKKLQQVEQILDRQAKKIANGIFGNTSVLRAANVDDSSTMSAEALTERLSDNDTVRAAYLADQGETLEPVMQDKEFSKFGNAALKTFVDQVGEQELARLNVAITLGEKDETYTAAAEQVRQIIRNRFIRERYSMLKRKPELMEARIQRYMENNVTDIAVEDFIRHAWEFYQDGGQTKGEVDRWATRDALQAKTDRSKVKQWLLGQLDGLLGEPGIYNGKERFTASGNRRSFDQLHYAYTAENIVRAMTGNQRQRGEGTFGVSATALLSTATPEYSSIDDIKADSSRLRQADDEEYKELLEDLDGDIDTVVKQVRRQNKPHSDNSFEEGEIIGGILMDAATGKQTPAAIIKAFSKEGYTIDKDTAKLIQALYHSAAQLPTGYFEAKPERVVKFNEVLAVVVPDNTGADMMQQIQSTGMPVKTYTAGDEQSRLQVVNSVEGAKFSVRETDDGTPFVHVDVDQARFDGLTTAEMAKEARNVLREKFQGKSVGSGYSAYVGSTTVKEFTHPANRRIKQDVKEAKFRASPELDRLLEVSNYLGNEPDDGRHPQATGGFDKFQTHFVVGGHAFEGTIFIMVMDDHNLFYDVTKIKDITRSTTGLAMTAVSGSPSDVSTRDNSKTAENVNPQFSARLYSETDDDILTSLDPNKLTTQAEREAYFRWERRRAQYQNWQNKVDDLQREYDSIEDKSGGRARNLAAQISQYMPQIDNAMQRAETVRDGSRALQDVIARERADALVKGTQGRLTAEQSTTLKQLRNEANRLRRKLAELQRQGTQTTAETVQLNQAEVKRLADKLAEGTKTSGSEVMYELSNLVTAVAKGGYIGGEQVAWNEIYDMANNVAERIVQGYGVDISQIDSRYDAILGKTVTVPATEWADIRASGLDARARNVGIRLKRVANNETSQIEDFVATVPGVADEGDSVTGQLETIVSDIEALQNNAVQFVDLQQETEELAQTILDAAFDISQQQTSADRMAVKQDAQAQRVREQQERKLAKAKEKQAATVERTKARYEEKLQKAKEKLSITKEEMRKAATQRVQEARQKQHLRDMAEKKRQDEARRERTQAKGLREKIIRHAADMSRKLLNPTDKQHIPEHLRESVAAVLDSINLISKKNIESDADLTKRTQAFIEAKEAYRQILLENNGEIVIDPSLLDGEGNGYFERLIALRNTPIASMNNEQLQLVWDTLKAMEASIQTAGKALSNAKFERMNDWAGAFQDAVQTRKQKKSVTSKHYMLDMETPLTFFSHFGEAGNAVYRMLRDAQDRQQIMVDEVAADVRGVMGDKPQQTMREMQKDIKTFHFADGDLTLSADQRAEVYLLMKRQQAQEHLLVGGIVQPEVKYAKKTIRRGTQAVHMTLEEISQITSALTEEQAKLADGMQGIISGRLSDYGNEASMQAYGYKKFREANYWPIRSASEEVHSSVEKGGDNTISVKNFGMAKSTVAHANNGVDLSGVFDTFSRHASEMTTYAAWLCPMEDAGRLYNWKYSGYNEEGQRITTGTIKGILDEIGGAGASSYWLNLMADIQSGIGDTKDSAMGSIPAKLLGNAKGAAVGANLRVVIQQPTALFRAMVVWSPADLMRGLTGGATRGGGFKRAEQYSPIAARKAQGGFDISSSGQMSEILYDDTNRLSKISNALSWGAGKADEITWGYLWNCAERKVQKAGELEVGSDEFYAEVNRQFTEMIDATQVVDGVLQRSQIMRSSNAWNKMATAFMGEPTMSFNVMMRAADQFLYETDNAKRKQAGGRILRGASVLLVTSAVNGVMKSLIDAMRDDDKDKDYWERFLSAFSGVDGTEENAFQKILNIAFNGNALSDVNPLEQIPYVKDIVSIFQGYDVGRMDMDSVSELISCGQNVVSALQGSSSKTTAYTLEQLAAKIAELSGLSVGNITRDVWSVLQTIASGQNNYWVQYKMDRAIYELFNSSNKSMYMETLMRAYLNDPSAYADIEQDIIDSGIYTSEDIADYMAGQWKSGVQSAETELEMIEQETLGERMADSGFISEDDMSAYITKYQLLLDNPDFDGSLTNAQAAKYYSAAEPAGIDLNTYYEFTQQYSQLTGDKDASGKDIEGSTKKDKVMQWINSQELSRSQKDALYLVYYKQSTLDDTPWH